MIDIDGVSIALPAFVLVEPVGMHEVVSWLIGCIEKRASAAVWRPHRLSGTKLHLSIAYARKRDSEM